MAWSFVVLLLGTCIIAEALVDGRSEVQNVHKDADGDFWRTQAGVLGTEVLRASSHKQLGEAIGKKYKSQIHKRLKAMGPQLQKAQVISLWGESSIFVTGMMVLGQYILRLDYQRLVKAWCSEFLNTRVKSCYAMPLTTSHMKLRIKLSQLTIFPQAMPYSTTRVAIRVAPDGLQVPHVQIRCKWTWFNNDSMSNSGLRSCTCDKACIWCGMSCMMGH